MAGPQSESWISTHHAAPVDARPLLIREAPRECVVQEAQGSQDPTSISRRSLPSPSSGQSLLPGSGTSEPLYVAVIRYSLALGLSLELPNLGCNNNSGKTKPLVKHDQEDTPDHAGGSGQEERWSKRSSRVQ